MHGAPTAATPSTPLRRKAHVTTTRTAKEWQGHIHATLSKAQALLRSPAFFEARLGDLQKNVVA